MKDDIKLLLWLLFFYSDHFELMCEHLVQAAHLQETIIRTQLVTLYITSLYKCYQFTISNLRLTLFVFLSNLVNVLNSLTNKLKPNLRLFLSCLKCFQNSIYNLFFNFERLTSLKILF